MAKIPDQLSYKIVSHLQERFKQRHNVVLNREKRLALLNQIKSGTAKRLYVFPDKKIIYRVFLRNEKQQMDMPYHVIYNPTLEHIVTVLPSKDSPEYLDFVREHNFDKDIVDMRYMTPQERTGESIKRYRENQKEQERQEKINLGKMRLEAWKRLNGYRKSLTNGDASDIL